MTIHARNLQKLVVIICLSYAELSFGYFGATRSAVGIIPSGQVSNGGYIVDDPLAQERLASLSYIDNQNRVLFAEALSYAGSGYAGAEVAQRGGTTDARALFGDGLTLSSVGYSGAHGYMTVRLDTFALGSGAYQQNHSWSLLYQGNGGVGGYSQNLGFGANYVNIPFVFNGGVVEFTAEVHTGFNGFVFDKPSGGKTTMSWGGIQSVSLQDGTPVDMSAITITSMSGVNYLASIPLQNPISKVSPVPEAEPYAMLLAGLGLVGFAVRRRGRVCSQPIRG